MSQVKASTSNICQRTTRMPQSVPSVRRFVALPAAVSRVAARRLIPASCAPPATAEAPVASTGLAPTGLAPTGLAPTGLMVAKEGKIHGVAGRIAVGARIGEAMEVCCVGPQTTNKAVKAIIISRGYLEQNNVDLSFRPSRRRYDPKVKSDDQLKLELVHNPSRFTFPSEDQDVVSMSISAKTKPQKIGGALTSMVQEGRSVALTAIGADAVMNAVKAVACARRYLEESGKDLRLAPEFIKVMSTEKGEINAIRMWVLVDEKPKEPAQQ